MITALPLHPDDVLFFTEVTDVIKRVAKHYHLPLTAVEALRMPATGMADRLGECSHSGVIRLVLRCTIDGRFCDAPRSPDEVWNTAAHELAHLRHMNHGLDFQIFELEMRQAVANMKVDHRQKVIDRLRKMQAARDGEAQLGNIAAAESFATAFNSMMLKHELNQSDLDHAAEQADDPVVQISTDLERYRIERKRTRIAWQEQLARIVAQAHLCTFLVSSGQNTITFVGTKSHATVAEYVYGTLVPAAQKMCQKAYQAYGMEGSTDGRWRAREPGFNESWLAAFTQRLGERFAEVRAVEIATAPSSSVAMVRLDGALVKVRAYIDDRFKRKASPLQRVSGNHAEGRSRGRAAADAVQIGRRGIAGGSMKLLT